MARGFLTAAERTRLSNFPQEIASDDLGRYFTRTADDLAQANKQRGDHNRLGFALQLCTSRYLGFIPDDVLDPPPVILRLLAHHLEVSTDDFGIYGQRQQAQHPDGPGNAGKRQDRSRAEEPSNEALQYQRCVGRLLLEHHKR